MLLFIYYDAKFRSYLKNVYRFSDKFSKLGKRKKNINLDEENKDLSATVDCCASLGQLIDKY